MLKCNPWGIVKSDTLTDKTFMEKFVKRHITLKSSWYVILFFFPWAHTVALPLMFKDSRPGCDVITILVGAFGEVNDKNRCCWHHISQYSKDPKAPGDYSADDSQALKMTCVLTWPFFLFYLNKKLQCLIPISPSLNEC